MPGQTDKEEVDTIFRTFDYDGNQIITVNEFVTAAMDRKSFLSEERLKLTF